ncbi:MAG: ATP-binding protein [Campylobacter sp.]|nr:MAG: ATP-binding protein [Campylobacter sp.]
MIKRAEYINELKKWQDEQVIKVITGIRRCGKSTLMSQFIEHLRDSGVGGEQIISINFEELEFEELLEYKKLYEYIKLRLVSDKKSYIFLDEIQKVAQFEKVVDSLYVKPDIDIYITGSNAYMLSAELATLLTGRYAEIKMLPLSFAEFASVSNLSIAQAFSAYLKNGGFPYIATMNNATDKIDTYLEGIYNTVIVKDIEYRQSKRQKEPDRRKVTDITLLKNIAKYLSSVVGSPISIKSITDYLISSGRKVSPNTVGDYVDALCEAFIFYPVERFDIVGKQILKTNPKLYIVDLGLRNHILPRRDYDFGFSIENIVYFELLRRGYRVHIGKQGENEVDFVIQKDGIYTYIQVTTDITARQTFEREIRPLKAIKDNYKKLILTADQNTLGNYDGIEVINLLEWLLKTK